MKTKIWIALYVVMAAGPALGQAPISGDPLDFLDAGRYGPGTLIAAMEALATYRPAQAIAPVRLLLSNPDPDVARMAGWLLRRMGYGDSSAGIASGVLGDTAAMPAARAAAALALGALRSANGAGPLRTALAGDPNPAVRAASASALGDLHRAGSAGALTTALTGDPEPDVQQAAARAMGQLPDADSAALLQALAAEDALVRLEAVYSLGRLGVITAVSNLIGTLQNDSDCRVRAAAAWALGALGDPLAVDALRAAQNSTCRLAAQAAQVASARF
jgi:HEAT repeat protein